MDTTTVNRESQMMEPNGLDLAAVRETIRIQMERKARFGLVSVVCLMLGLGAVGLFTPGEAPSAAAGFGPESAAAARDSIVSSHLGADAATGEAILWFIGADAPVTAAAVRTTQLR